MVQQANITESVVNCSAYMEGCKVSDIEIKDIRDVLKRPNQFVWIEPHEPSTETLAKFQQELGLHELAIEDAHRAHQRPKLEAYGDTIFIVLRTARMNDQRIELGETHFFLGSNFLVTVRHGSSKTYTQVRTRCESTPDLLRKGPGFALYAVMDAIVDEYFPVIDALEIELSEPRKRYSMKNSDVNHGEILWTQTPDARCKTRCLTFDRYLQSSHAV